MSALLYEYTWKLTTHGVYRAIYDEHHDDFSVDGCDWHNEPQVLTEWGFKDADYPLIRSIGMGEYESRKWTYFIFDGVVRCEGDDE